MQMSLLAEARAEAAAAGLNLFGLVERERFDACQPKEQRVVAMAPACGTLLILASGGRQLWREYEGWRRGGTAVGRSVTAFASEGVARIARMLRARAIVNQVVELDLMCRLNVGRLGEAAGFGIVSPVSGLLLHPEFGPWLRLRAAVLVDGQPFGPIADASITDRFQPCCACSRPCITACPAEVHDGAGRQDLSRCAGHRHGGGCTSGCDSRAACPVGSEHRDAPGENVHRHGHDLAVLQRGHGLGSWRFLPKFLRGTPRS